MARLPQEEREILEARHQLWRRGILTWKLDTVQRQVYNFIETNPKKISTLVLPRRVGKSFILTTMAVELAIKRKKAIIKFLQPEQKMIRMNIRPIMDAILDDCPSDLRPKFKTQDSIYLFPNGSEIQLAGTDNGNHEKLRGGNSDLCLIDEAGFVDKELDYIVKSVLLPTTLLTNGKIILSSTPPKSPSHAFEEYRQQAALTNGLFKINIYDAIEITKNEEKPRITKHQLQEIIDEYPGGEKSDDFRREMLCETLVDGSNSVIPEFTEELEEEIVKEWRRPIFCDKYVGMDIGFKDYTAALFGYYDFDNAVIVIEDEYLIHGPKMTLDVLGKDLKKKEADLWTNKLTGEFEAPFKRVSDNNLIVLNELHQNSKILFLPADKDNKEAALNDVRIMLKSYRIIINPRCKNLISHLKNAVWDKAKKKFLRSADNGHYDTIDALIYLVRHVDQTHNPYPPGYRHQRLSEGNRAVFYTESGTKSDVPDYQKKLEKMFKVKSSMKINKFK